MPNNCSTLIQRKQNILHKALRSSSEGKLQNAVTENTSELHVAGTRKVPASSSTNHIPTGTNGGATTARRTNVFAASRVQPTANQNYQTHLPSIRDAAGPVDRQQLSYEDFHFRARPKTPLVSTSPKSPGRPPSESISSLFHTLAKRSTENFMSSNGELDGLVVPPSRRSRRPSNESTKYGTGTNPTPTKQAITSPQRYSGDSGADSRYSVSPPETNHHQRVSPFTNKLRSMAPNVQIESPLGHDSPTKERTNGGQLYQRRINNNLKSPLKQKVDKYRRRSEEVIQAMNGTALMNTTNAGLSPTTPPLTLTTPTSTRSKPPPATARRIASDGEIQARLDVLRLAMDANLVHTDQQQAGRDHLKSPHLYTTHQQLAPLGTPPTPSVLLRRSQPISSLNPTTHRQNHAVNHRRQQISTHKQSNTTGQGNLYLAFIASRHLSSLEDTLLESDNIDHPKLLRIFTWLKNVEEYRPEQLDHEQLIIEQNQRMLDQEENLSLYSEIQYAVDDLPPNTTGKPCEKIATMQFED